MSIFANPFDSKTRLRCSCGQHTSQEEHESAAAARLLPDSEALSNNVVEQAVMRALFPVDSVRRRFLQAVGTPTAMAAVSAILPMAAVKDAFAQGAKLEKQKLSVGFIPITCATPIIMADPMGFYKKQGLDVSIVKTAGWAVIRDKTLNKEYDAAHMLSPMPLRSALVPVQAPCLTPCPQWKTSMARRSRWP
jgi:nitrate/nitrite transport system substrate-binding protein